MRPTLFLDCDGVLNTDPGAIGVLRPEECVLLAGAGTALGVLNRAGILAIGITNRSQVARGYITEPVLISLLDDLRAKLKTDGGIMDGIFYCPHYPPPAPEGANLAYVKDCECRKPKPGLFLQAMEAFPIDTARSAMVGDSLRDIASGQNFGIPGWAVRTGKACAPGTGEAVPDLWFASVSEAAAYAVSMWGG
jgi:D,D-heptose 1,7-bisphosphate phosphatase